MKKVTLVFEENQLPLVSYDYDGMAMSYHVYHDDLLHAIQQATFEPKEEKVLTIVSPALPANTVKYANKSNGLDIVFMTFEIPSFNVSYHKQIFKDVPFPKMVFGFIVKNNLLVRAYVACYKDRFLRDKTQLFHFPYSNVYENGNLCFYDKPEIPDLVALQHVPYQWLETDNNDHLYFQGRTNQLDQPLREIFEKSKGKPFDNDILTPFNKTFEEWANIIIS